MLTQSTPAVINALRGVLPPGAIKQLTQALGNCNQPLTHRGGVNLQPAQQQQSGGRGVYNNTGWNVNEYGDLINFDERSFYDMPGFNSEWNSYNYGGDNFYFPTTQNFTINNYSSGGGNNLGGETTTERLFTRELYFLGPPGADGIDGRDGRDGLAGIDGINGLNGLPGQAGAAGQAGQAGAAGPPGAPGGAGARGAPGAPGAAGQNGRDGLPGRNGMDGLNGWPGLPGIPGRNGRDGKDAKVASFILNYLSGANPRVNTVPIDITYATAGLAEVAVSGGEISYTTDTVGIPTTFTLDPDTCAITAGGVIDITFVTGVTISPLVVTPTPAATETSSVLSDATLEGVVPIATRVAVPA
jgi:hypothetical protein